MHEKVAARNPFSPANAAARKAQLMESLRADRGIPKPRVPEQTDAPAAGSNPAQLPDGSPQPNGAPAEPAVPANAPAPTTAQAPAASDAQNEWYKREQAAQEAAKKAHEAQSGADKRIAEADARLKAAEAKEQRLIWAKSNPLEFISEIGMTETEWKDFLANGGKLTVEQQRVRELEKNLAETRTEMQQMLKSQKDAQAHAARMSEEAQFSATLSNYTFVPQMGGVTAVRARQQLLMSQTGAHVTMADAAKNLEQDMEQGLANILKHEQIRSKLGLDVNTPKAGQAATQPRTLNQRVSSESSSMGAADKPHPTDFKGKMKLYMQRVEQEKAASRR